MEYEACEDLQQAGKVAHEALAETEQPSQQFGCLGEIAGAEKKHSLDRKHSCENSHQFPGRQDCSCILVTRDGMEGPSSCKAGHHCGCWIFLLIMKLNQIRISTVFFQTWMENFSHGDCPVPIFFKILWKSCEVPCMVPPI